MNLRFYACLTLFVILATGSGKGQNATAFADTKLYDAVLDRLFQHDVRPESSEVQLRYTYCDKGEMQIVVHRLKNSDFFVDVWYVTPGSPNVWKQLATLVQSNQSLDTEKVASLIRITHKTLVSAKVTPLGTLIEKAGSLSIPLLNPNTVTLDGMAYGISIRSISEDASLTLQGSQRAEQSDSQLIRWMGQVRSSLEAQLMGS